jgi:cell fate (sporulation/competence/biofilm development) regulator YlbF (YheA/YmcA/DUF963 family)
MGAPVTLKESLDPLDDVLLDPEVRLKEPAGPTAATRLGDALTTIHALLEARAELADAEAAQENLDDLRHQAAIGTKADVGAYHKARELAATVNEIRARVDTLQVVAERRARAAVKARLLEYLELISAADDHVAEVRATWDRTRSLDDREAWEDAVAGAEDLRRRAGEFRGRLAAKHGDDLILALVATPPEDLGG